MKYCKIKGKSESLQKKKKLEALSKKSDKQELVGFEQLLNYGSL